MAFDAGAIVSKLVLDKQSWDQSVQDVGSKQKTLGGYVQANSAKFKSMGRAMTIAGGLIVASLGAMIKKASDAQEITARFGTVFQDVFPKASTAAKNLANDYGLSTVAAKDLLGATGDLLTGLGMQSGVALTLSEKTQQLAVDLASFTNFSGGAKGASDALTKAMLGERESVKALGIVITEEMVKEQLLKEGKEDLTGQALLQAKAEATLTIAISQSKNAMGDYARTSGSLANKSRELKARMDDLFVEIGTKLVPVITSLATKATEIVTKISDWIKEHPKLTEIITKAALGIGALMLVLGPLVMMLPAIVTALPLIAAGFTALLGPIGLVAVGIGAITAAAVIAYNVINNLTKAKNAMIDADERAATATHNFGQKLRKISDLAGLTRKEFIALTRKYDDNTLALAMAIKRGEEGVELQEAMAEVGKENIKRIDKEKEALGKLDEDGYKPLNITIPKVTEKTKTWVDYIADMGIKTVKQKSNRVDELEGFVDDLSQAYKDGIIDLEDYIEAVKVAKGEIETLSTTVEDTALPAFRDMSGVVDLAVGEMTDRIPDITTKIAEEAGTITTRWSQLGTDIAGNFNDTVFDLLSKGTDLDDGMKLLFDGILNSFKSMVADMVTTWMVDFVKEGIVKGSKKAGDAASTLAGGAASLGTAITSLATGIASILPAIAEGIAAAAKILVAALPDIIAIAAVALAIYAGFLAVTALFSSISGGGGGMMDATNRELHNIWEEARNILNISRNLKNITTNMMKSSWKIQKLLVTIKDKLGQASEVSADFSKITKILHKLKEIGWKTNKLLYNILQQLSGTQDPTDVVITDSKLDVKRNNMLNDMRGYLMNIRKFTMQIRNGIRGLTSAQGGATVTSPQLVMTHGTPGDPEHIIPDHMMGTELASTGKRVVKKYYVTINNKVNLKGLVVTDKEYARKRMIPEIIEALDANFKKTAFQQALGIS